MKIYRLPGSLLVLALLLLAPGGVWRAEGRVVADEETAVIRQDCSGYSGPEPCYESLSAWEATPDVTVGVPPGSREAVQGEHFYVAQTVSGSGSGADCANARAVGWFNTAANWTTAQGSDGLVGPGDTIHLCGVFSPDPGDTVLTIQEGGTAGSPITILFEQGARLTSPWFGGRHTMDGGAIFIDEKDYIVIDGGENGIIESTDTGSEGYFTYHDITGNFGVYIRRCSNVEVKNLTIQNLYQARNNEVPTHTYTRAVNVDYSDHVSIHGNRIAYVGIGIYVAMQENTGVDVFDNEMSQIGVGLFSGGYTHHAGPNLEFHHNRVYDTTPWGYNDGVKFFAVPDTTDPYWGIRVYNNIIGPKISYPGHPATAWILADQGWIMEPEIYNNLLIGDANDNAANGYITVGGNGHATGLTLAQNARIYNNTIVSEYASSDIAILIGKRSTGNILYNNAFAFTGNVTAVYLNDEYTELADCDYNSYYSEGSVTYPGQSDPALDTHSLFGDPLLDEDHRPTSASPIIDTGKALDSSYASSDLDDVARPQGAGWDIGAYEFAPALALRGTGGNRVIHLDWTVNASLPATSTWQIGYYTTTAASTVVVTDSLTHTARAHTLTDLENGRWYTVTLSTVGVTPPLSDTVPVQLMEHFVYLPLVMRED